jgi:hypothetical protein
LAWLVGKNALCTIGEGALVHSARAQNEQNHVLLWLITRQISKTFSYVQSKQEETEEAKK